MRRFIPAILFILLAAGSLVLRAQVVPSAYARGLSITAGGEASAFQPDYAGFGIPQTSPNRLYGIGAYVDVKFNPWVQIEGEGRWLRFNQLAGIYENSYLIGPRLPIYKLHFWRATPYGKVLIGYGRLNFEDNNGWGRYTALAYGGGLDIKMSKRLSLRLPDFEYQQWPKWSEGTGRTYNLCPYGLSIGVSYKVFGRK
ncbi:MAG TPA: outer membrane beta-barrel protein [Terracidiphilus sp.]